MVPKNSEVFILFLFEESSARQKFETYGPHKIKVIVFDKSGEI